MVRLIAALCVIATVGVGAAFAWDQVGGVVQDLVDEPADCTATVDGSTATVSHEQAQNASLIAAIGVQRGLPARAVTIALATAIQESKLHNISYGDRDSVGLFQQRPSQGWGNADELQDPVFATNAFYDALVQHDFTSMEVTEAAQAVQRSAYPAAYAEHEREARVLASALTGWSPATFTCKPGTSDSTGDLAEELETRFDEVVTVRGDLSYLTPPNRRVGWAMAHWAVANADRLGVSSVRFGSFTWTAEDGWDRTSGRRAQLLIYS